MVFQSSYFTDSGIEIDTVDDLAKAGKQREAGVNKMKELGIMMENIRVGNQE